MLCSKLWKQTSTGVNVSDEANCILPSYTFLAQNTQHDKAVIQGFVQYVNEQIILMKFKQDQIVSIDETDRYFDMNEKSILADCGD
jgi:hypothetical protein